MAKNMKNRKPRTAKKTATKPKVSSTLALAVKSIISKELENKYVTSFPGRANAVYPGVAWAGAGSGILQIPQIRNNGTVTNIVPLMPPIQQGLADFNRVGDKIRPINMTVHFDVSMFTKNINSNYLLVRLLCLSDKSIKDTEALNFNTVVPQTGTPVDTQLFDYGNGTNGAFNGVPYDVNWRINRKRYTVHHDRVFKLLKGYGNNPQSTNPVPYAGAITDQNPLSTQRLTFKIRCPQELKYQSATSQFPTNFAPFWCLGFIQPDGDGTTGYLDNQVLVNYTTHFDYEDA